MNLLKKRYQDNKKSRFQMAQTKQFLKLLNNTYEKALEIGCGKGYWSYVGAKYKKFIECCGCDVFNDYQTQEIKQFCRKIEYKKIKGKILPYEANQFDMVFSMDVIEHIKDDAFFIKEHLRVCKKGGEIIIGTPNYWRITNILLLLLGKLKYPRNMGLDSYGDCIHLREYKIQELKSLVIKAGGKNIKIYPCWIGILCLSLGIERFPKFLNNFCHFWLIKFTKI
ncbi:MAG: class I SAM-dependent methyltransferase [Patescibacteria group bacterium]|nr:class I SAM-dependent methyltransferase [Patescibacteria group bacterium]